MDDDETGAVGDVLDLDASFMPYRIRRRFSGPDDDSRWTLHEALGLPSARAFVFTQKRPQHVMLVRHAVLLGDVDGWTATEAPWTETLRERARIYHREIERLAQLLGAADDALLPNPNLQLAVDLVKATDALRDLQRQAQERGLKINADTGFVQLEGQRGYLHNRLLGHMASFYEMVNMAGLRLTPVLDETDAGQLSSLGAEEHLQLVDLREKGKWFTVRSGYDNERLDYVRALLTNEGPGENAAYWRMLFDRHSEEKVRDMIKNAIKNYKKPP